MICESLTLNELTIGHVLEVESPTGPVRAVVHPLTLTEPARKALGVSVPCRVVRPRPFACFWRRCWR